MSEVQQTSNQMMNGDFNDRVKPIQLHDIKPNGSERKILELMIFQTKQLEQTKISFEETNLEIKYLKEIIRKMDRTPRMTGKKHMKKVGEFDLEMKKLRNELRLALEAEDKSKEAMDDLAIALNEVSTDTKQTKAQLKVRQTELDKATEEAKNTKSLLHTTEQNLVGALNEYDKMKMEYEESMSSSKAKEESFLSCMNISEEEIAKWKQENNIMNDVWKIAKEDNAKLRQIMKESVNEAIGLKEALELVRSENSQMKDQLIEKGNSLQQIRQDYEDLKVSEASALDSVQELNNLLASSSIADSKKISNSSRFRSFRLPKGTHHDAEGRKSLTIFSDSTFYREKSIESSCNMFSSLRKGTDNGVPSSLFSGERGNQGTETFDHLEGIHQKNRGNMNLEKKKTVFGRFGDALRRTSFHK